MLSGGFIDEKIYDYNNDPDEVAETLLKMTPEQLLAKEKEIITPWPNTYTYTKSLSERSLQKHRGNIPVCILRPAIIYAAYSEPLPGWTDSLAAGGIHLDSNL